MRSEALRHCRGPEEGKTPGSGALLRRFGRRNGSGQRAEGARWGGSALVLYHDHSCEVTVVQPNEVAEREETADFHHFLCRKHGERDENIIKKEEKKTDKRHLRKP